MEPSALRRNLRRPRFVVTTRPQEPDMSDKPTKTDPHPGMMGDGTEEQNLGQKGDPKARITKEEVEEAFKDAPKEK